MDVYHADVWLCFFSPQWSRGCVLRITHCISILLSFVFQQHHVFFSWSSEIDVCESQPCEHGGTCIGAFNSYSCSCIVGTTGARCETGEQNSTLHSLSIITNTSGTGCKNSLFRGIPIVTAFYSHHIKLTNYASFVLIRLQNLLVMKSSDYITYR